ncbi:unnamed protein product [Calypogeia fissa]
MEDFEGVIPGKINGVFERADEFGQDGRQRRRTAMAAVVFVALSLLLQHEEAVSAEAMAAVRFEIPAAFPWEKVQLDQLAPSKGTCATCIGVVDETLGACNATANCVSSFDDRPRFFVAPWEFPGKLPFAVEKLTEVLLSSGAQIEEQGERYLHAVFTSKEGVVDDVEFLFSDPREDATVVLRSASRAISLDDKDRNRKRLEEIRKSLTWEQVPVLRNRKRTFFFLESPWDTFGPEPPPSFDYKDDLEFVPE